MYAVDYEPTEVESGESFLTVAGMAEQLSNGLILARRTPISLRLT